MTVELPARTRSEKHADFFLSRLNPDGALSDLAARMLRLARVDANAEAVLTYYAKWVRGERTALSAKAQYPSDPVLRTLQPHETRVAAALYLWTCSVIESNGMNVDSILDFAREEPSTMINAATNLEDGFGEDLWVETERRCGEDPDLARKLDDGARRMEFAAARVGKAVKPVGEERPESPPDFMQMTGVEILVTVLVIYGLLEGHRRLSNLGKDDD